MKPLKSNRICLIGLGTILFCHTAGAATIVKANNATQLNNNAAWVGNVQPGATDIALWDSTVTTATASANFFNANGSPVWGQVAITNPGADIFISDSGNHQLKLDGVSDGSNAVGLDMSAATVDLRIGATVILNNPQQFKVAAGRTVTFFGGITNAERLTFTGAGNLTTSNNITLTTAQPFTGKTRVAGATLTLNTAAQLAATSAVEVSGGSLLIGGTTGVGAANRINPAASLTIGGSNGPGTVTLAAGATPVNSQTFTGLNIDKGFGNIVNANGAAALTFNGAYSRQPGGFTNFAANAANFGTAPTGAGVVGSGGNEILLGATLADSDFIKAAAGNVTAATYSTDLFGAGLNTNLTVAGTFADVTAQSLRLAGATYTLSGINTIESGMITVGTTGTASLLGGTIRPGAGRNLVTYTANAKNLVLGSVVADNGGASGFEKFGAGTINITGDNTFTGPIYLQGGFIELRNPNALGSPAATAALNVTGGIGLRSGTGATNVTISRPIILASGQGLTYDTNGAANTVTISGPLQATAFAQGGVAAGGTSTLTKNGEGTMIFSGTTTAVANQNLGINIGGGRLDISGNFTGAAGAFGFTGRNMSSTPPPAEGTLVPEINVLSGGTLSNAKDWNFSGENNSLTLNMAENSTAVAGRLFVGKGKSTVARFNQNGGNLAASFIGLNSDNYVDNDGARAFSGIYSLNGGTLTNQSVTAGNGGVMNLNGGLWKVTGGGTVAPTFTTSSGLLTYGKIYVKAGGAKVEATAGVTNVNLPLDHEVGLTGNDGGLTKTGTGTLSINSPSTYNGGTRLLAGPLVVGIGPVYGTMPVTNGKLGSGNVSVEGGTLTLTSPDAIADNAVLSFSGATPPVINLNSATAEVLGTVVDGNNTAKQLATGTYTATQLNTFFEKTVFAGTGSVQVTLVPAVGGYDTWATNNGLTPANNAKIFDADNDGYNNLLEYAVGGAPLDGSSRGVSLLKAQNVAGQPAMTLTASIRSGAVFAAGPSGALVASLEGSTYYIEASSDLVNWNRSVTEIAPITTGVPVTPPAGTVYHTFQTAAPTGSTPKEFIRLRVTTP